ncbi:MAG: hypothetical protein MI717_00805 [Spirochaetales bacterium]|nr:hypothetical protein [Spirochaetales bacterium]
MKKTIVHVLPLFCFLMYGSCDEGLFSQMLRVAKDPFPAKPIVYSLKEPHCIQLSWAHDACADSYVLYRSVDSPEPHLEPIYQGVDLHFIDSDLIHEQRYLYALGKIRGHRLFGPYDLVLGVSSSFPQDGFEPNDWRSLATELLDDLTANIFFYAGFDGRWVSDEDWYWVTVPPRRQANILVVQKELVNTSSALFLHVDGDVTVSLVNNMVVPLTNTTHQEQKIRFRISPNPQQFAHAATLLGGRTLVYELQLHSITSLGGGG